MFQVLYHPILLNELTFVGRKTLDFALFSPYCPKENRAIRAEIGENRTRPPEIIVWRLKKIFYETLRI